MDVECKQNVHTFDIISDIIFCSIFFTSISISKAFMASSINFCSSTDILTLSVKEANDGYKNSHDQKKKKEVLNGYF